MTVMGADHAAEAVTEVNIRAGLILAIRERELGDHSYRKNQNLMGFLFGKWFNNNNSFIKLNTLFYPSLVFLF